MRIVLAPDKFKGTLTAAQAARSMARGVGAARSDVEVELCPVADGGEGTVPTLVAATEGETRRVHVTGPMGGRVEAEFGLLGDKASAGGPRTAVVEMATASGLELVPKAELNPLRASTYGTGELIAAAMDAGVERVIVGIGGSATTDCGTGMARALGVRFLDQAGGEVPEGGGALGDVARIDASRHDPRLAHVEFLVACDVDSPLFGPEGAAHVYAPQKGASPEDVEVLDAGLKHMAAVIRRDLGVDVSELPGAGAAGGLGAGLVAFCGGRLLPGAEFVLEAVGAGDRLAGAALVITGEGRMDGQSLRGKAPLAVARMAKRMGVHCVAIVGQTGPEIEKVREAGVSYVYSMTREADPDEAMAHADELVARLAERATREFLSGCA